MKIEIQLKLNMCLLEVFYDSCTLGTKANRWVKCPLLSQIQLHYCYCYYYYYYLCYNMKMMLIILIIIIHQIFSLVRDWSKRVTATSSKLTVLHELCSRKTVRFSEQIMSTDKYLSIFSCQMKAIVYLLSLPLTRWVS